MQPKITYSLLRTDKVTSIETERGYHWQWNAEFKFL